ncbi:hypothetical protein SALB1_0375 [Salinisphaera sp. LB1]|nr:hypothetical protein SALB1_0375 [Salinisphaera sp. LB1]
MPQRIEHTIACSLSINAHGLCSILHLRPLAFICGLCFCERDREVEQGGFVFERGDR